MKVSIKKQIQKIHKFSISKNNKIKQILIEYLVIFFMELFIQNINSQINSEVTIKING